MTMIDDYSRFCVVFLLKSKSEAASKIEEYVRWTENIFGRKVRVVRSDGGGEYIAESLQDFYRAEGIRTQFSTPYSPQSNGIAERKNRTLQEMANCMLLDAGLPKRYWGEAIMTAAFIQNRLPSRATDRTPFELWTGSKPDFSRFRVFGCEAYVYVPDAKRKKFDAKSKKLTFVGYSDNHKGYRFVDRETNRITVSRDARFIELGNGSEQQEEQVTPPEMSVDPEVAEREQSVEPECEVIFEQSVEKEAVEEPEEEPSDYREALRIPEWRKAMREEMDAHKVNETWNLVKLPVGKKIIGAKWVFKLKRNEAGEAVKHKARIVAQGYTQTFGIDYSEVFAPVTRQTTLRAMLAVAGKKGLLLKQYDVKTAYLNGTIDEELYMRQPPGFQTAESDMVCKLQKSIYGLKQSARCWNKALHSVLIELGFTQCNSDPCLYIRRSGRATIYLLVYVDDLLMGSTDEAEMDEIFRRLREKFDITSLGLVRHFLGHEIYTLRLTAYIDYLVRKFGMEDAHPVRTPMDPGYTTANEGSKPFTDKTVYRSLIGALLYLAVNARPDLSIIVWGCSEEKYPTRTRATGVRRSAFCNT
ncbi:hypothetical protein RP20_CCG025870 [Aedes albopictus]|nr:hypothetical protein RP20_CCG025870 [Aedes albopictus]